MQSGRRKILAFEDDPLFQTQLELVLDDDEFELTIASHAVMGLRLLNEQPFNFDVVICDFDLPDMKGDEIARRVHFINPDIPIIFSTAHKEQKILLKLLQSGVARGFFLKGQLLDELKQIVYAAAENYHKRNRLIVMQSNTSGRPYNLVAETPVMRGLLKKIERYRELDLSILLLGESGTGKEVVARALHTGGPFVAINCAKYVADVHLLESELFGYVKGAFTGAEQNHIGLLETAKGGTLFLDEVHTLSLQAQQKLLRVLQEKKFRRVGDSSQKEIETEFRLVTAAKPDLQQRIAEGRFMIDFYYRINMLTLNIPALKERIDDIPHLIEFFASQANARLNSNVMFRSLTIENMKQYSWPGQVRELRNAVERLVVDLEGQIVEPIHFDEFVRSQLDSDAPVVVSDGKTYKEHSQASDYAYFKGLISSEADRSRWVEISGLSRATLYRKLSELELISPQDS